MASKFTRGTWRAVWNKMRRWWEVRTARDVVAVVYGGKPDAELMAASPRLLGSLKHMVAIVRMHEGELRASERAKLADAVALIGEVA